MRRCQKLFGWLLFAVAITSQPGRTQEAAAPGSHGDHPRYSAKLAVAAGDWNLFSGIELTREQESLIAAAYRARQPELLLLFERGRHPDNRQAMADSIARIQGAQRAGMRAVLTPEQQVRFDLNVTAILARARQERVTPATSNR